MIPGRAVTEASIISDEVRTVRAIVDGDRLLVSPEDLPAALGWALKPQGLCRQDVCVPIANPRALGLGGRLDIAAVAAALGRAVVVDPGACIAAVALGTEERRRALEGLEAPDFSLPDLDGAAHRLTEWRGRKRLLVTFSSWCGCRYDLPGWQSLHDELEPEGFSVLAVAIDHAPDDVRPFVADVTFPVLIDAQHLLTELYAISNVPTVVWIDEDGRIVRPNGIAFGTDTFSDFTKVVSGPHLDAVRRWVHDGELPLTTAEARGSVADLSADEVMARLHFRVGAEALRRGDEPAARRHLARAGELAPYDWTIRRAAMPLVGEDPFGRTFLDLYDEWQAAGSPYHGIPADAPD